MCIRGTELTARYVLLSQAAAGTIIEWDNIRIDKATIPSCDKGCSGSIKIHLNWPLIEPVVHRILSVNVTIDLNAPLFVGNFMSLTTNK